MAMGRRNQVRQPELWIATEDLPETPRHVFYDRLNKLLADIGFDEWIEERCAEFFKKMGRPGIPPGTYFRMLMVGYFEEIESQRGIAWRCSDSNSLKAFLGYSIRESTPDHSSLTKTKGRYPMELFQEVFQKVLEAVEDHGLLKGKSVGVDSTMLEANAAMRSIVRKDTKENYEDYLRRLAENEGWENPTREDLARFDKQRAKDGEKKVSNTEWESKVDEDSRIAKMKDGRTHLAYKAEHVVDLETGALLSAQIYTADQGDMSTVVPSLDAADKNLEAADSAAVIENVALDKGYYSRETLVALEERDVRPYVCEKRQKHPPRWTDAKPGEQEACRANRRRMKGNRGKQLRKLRGEYVERTFAHICETGGARRCTSRGLDAVQKRYLIAGAAYNLSLIMRALLGRGKPRALLACAWIVQVIQIDILWTSGRVWSLVKTRATDFQPRQRAARMAT